MKTFVKFTAAAAASLALSAVCRWRYTDTPSAPRLQSGVRHVACVGDSITFGAGVLWTRRTEAWPALLQKKLGAGTQVLNYGLSGRTLLSTGDRPYIREKYYQETFRCKPDTVLVLLGANDAKPYNWDADRYEQELLSFLARYIDVGARVVVMKPSKCFVLEGETEVGYDIRNDHILEELPMIDRAAAKLGIDVVDLYAFTENHPEWFDDGVHPNAAGNRAFAGYIFEKVFDQEDSL